MTRSGVLPVSTSSWLNVLSPGPVSSHPALLLPHSGHFHLGVCLPSCTVSWASLHWTAFHNFTSWSPSVNLSSERAALPELQFVLQKTKLNCFLTRHPAVHKKLINYFWDKSCRREAQGAAVILLLSLKTLLRHSMQREAGFVEDECSSWWMFRGLQVPP